jgi:pyruvate kinase
MATRPKLRRRRRTKIIATLGPASSSPEVLARLFQAGADVFRLNFSHGTHEDHAARFAQIRELEERFERPIGILADVQGPKLRVGNFSGGRVFLQTGQQFRLDLNPTPGSASRVNLPHPEIIEAASIGATLLLDDGKLRLRVARKRDDALETEVVVGGPLSDHKGVNVPDVVLPIPALTEKDRVDLAFALEHGANYIGLSFVQRPEDVAEAKKLIDGRAWVMVKLEKPQALENLDAIMDLTDAVMVARGDLGVELPPEEVPLAQKRIVRLARRLGKPVVVATQMLESMISAPAPTRAEASDVATAVFDGADAVMLSGETAAGQYPYEAVNIMDRIVARVEQDSGWRAMIEASRPDPEHATADAIAAAARQVCHTIGAQAVVAFTASGSTALRVARERPEAPIIGLTPHLTTARRMAVVWGVHAVVSQDAHSMGEAITRATRAAQTEGFAKHGDEIVVAAGVPFGHSGTTNSLRVATVR